MPRLRTTIRDGQVVEYQANAWGGVRVGNKRIRGAEDSNVSQNQLATQPPNSLDNSPGRVEADGDINMEAHGPGSDPPMALKASTSNSGGNPASRETPIIDVKPI